MGFGKYAGEPHTVNEVCRALDVERNMVTEMERRIFVFVGKMNNNALLQAFFSSGKVLSIVKIQSAPWFNQLRSYWLVPPASCVSALRK